MLEKTPNPEGMKILETHQLDAVSGGTLHLRPAPWPVLPCPPIRKPPFWPCPLPGRPDVPPPDFIRGPSLPIS